ncbi:hypothetical protein PHLH4_50930 [Pseudomonas sp. St316]|nr:hypothetical protein PHLH4_50930 [Pseudomonas sp. St316]
MPIQTEPLKPARRNPWRGDLAKRRAPAGLHSRSKPDSLRCLWGCCAAQRELLRVPTKASSERTLKIIFDSIKNSAQNLSTLYGMWTERDFALVKSQDILLMYKMASLHAQEELSPTGSQTVAWGGLSQIDLLPDDYSPEPKLITSPAPDKSWDNLEVAIKRIIDADSFLWEGWDTDDDPPTKRPQPSGRTATPSEPWRSHWA